MRCKALWIGILLTVLAFAVGPAAAQQVVYFKTGNQMAAMGHTVDEEEGMIHVQLGHESSIAFPVEMVDRVEVGGEVVTFSTDGAAVRNRMVNSSGSPVVDTRIGGRPPSHQTRGMWKGNQLQGNPRVVRDSGSGLAAYRPYMDDPRARKSNRKVVGRLDILSQLPKATDDGDPSTPVGARPFGKGSIGKMPAETQGKKKMLFEVR